MQLYRPHLSTCRSPLYLLSDSPAIRCDFGCGRVQASAWFLISIPLPAWEAVAVFIRRYTLTWPDWVLFKHGKQLGFEWESCHLPKLP